MPISLAELLELLPPAPDSPDEARALRSRVFVAVNLVNTYGGTTDARSQWVMDQVLQTLLGDGPYAEFVAAHARTGEQWSSGEPPVV